MSINSFNETQLCPLIHVLFMVALMLQWQDYGAGAETVWPARLRVREPPLSKVLLWGLSGSPHSTVVRYQVILLQRQNVESSLTLHHDAYVIHFPASHPMGILSPRIIPRRVSTVP